MAHRRHKEEEEDADVLKLGSGSWLQVYAWLSPNLLALAEFNTAGCLFISEVKSLLELRSQAVPDTPVFAKTLQYVNDFSKFANRDMTMAVREVLKREPQLTQFETAQIANLSPSTAEEAKGCIPSLVKIEDDRLQALLDEVQALRRYQA